MPEPKSTSESAERLGVPLTQITAPLPRRSTARGQPPRRRQNPKITPNNRPDVATSYSNSSAPLPF